MENKHVQVKQSLIPHAGRGLFAKVPFKAGMLIIEFKGRVYPMAELPADSNKSIVAFNDDTALYCDPNDLASFANDCIDFPELASDRLTNLLNTPKRNLLDALRDKRKPFYKIHPRARLNADIHLFEKTGNNRAFLRAIVDIKAGEEIFCHYGFGTWFQQEASKIGFNIGDEVERDGLPDDITSYPAFINYIKTFYPFVTRCIKISKDSDPGNDTTIIIEGGAGGGICMPVPRPKRVFRRVPASLLDALLNSHGQS